MHENSVQRSNKYNWETEITDVIGSTERDLGRQGPVKQCLVGKHDKCLANLLLTWLGGDLARQHLFS